MGFKGYSLPRLQELQSRLRYKYKLTKFSLSLWDIRASEPYTFALSRMALAARKKPDNPAETLMWITGLSNALSRISQRMHVLLYASRYAHGYAHAYVHVCACC